jgi:RHS repeat-associated protein
VHAAREGSLLPVNVPSVPMLPHVAPSPCCPMLPPCCRPHVAPCCRKIYTGVTTPQVDWCYDGRTYNGTGCTGSPTAGEIGFLTAAGNSVSWTEYRHQELGLVRWSRQTTGGISYAFETDPATHGDGYTYFEGRLTGLYYPSGRYVPYSYDSAGRASAVGGYVTSILYDPSGQPLQTTLGNGVVETRTIDTRLQTASIEAAKNGSLWKIENLFCPNQTSSCGTNNGNVTEQRQTIGSAYWSTAYSYDGVNRLTGATEVPSSGSGWTESYSYGDQFGNMHLTDTDGVVLTGLACSSYDSATNRCNATGFQYDGGSPGGPGNLTAVAGRTMTYDAENRQTSLTDSGTTHYYAYDAEGQRVQKVSGAETTTFVYDAFGQLVAEYGGGSFGGPGCSTCYVTPDHLGSTRVVTDGLGAVVRLWDYTPFGAEINGTFGLRPSFSGYVLSDTLALKFTGKPRDYESGLGLDYFESRYYSAAQGRFTSPDEFKGGIVDPFTGQDIETNTALPYADITDPQTLNKYAYVRNNPLRYTDPHGHCFWDLCIGEGAAVYAVGAAAVGTAAYLMTPQGKQSVRAAIEGTGLLINKAADGISSLFTKSDSKPGTLGKPDHQETVKEEGERVNGQTEVPIPTPGGAKTGRRADAVGTNPETGAAEIVQVYRPTPAGNIPKREKTAAADIQNATGVKPTMVPVRPVKPPQPPKPNPENP